MVVDTDLEEGSAEYCERMDAELEELKEVLLEHIADNLDVSEETVEIKHYLSGLTWE
jgi:hypothetical protein